METIKLGSKGDAVKKLQTLLHISADGVFGKNTKSALMSYQQSHGLYPDGICGQKTWHSLMGNSNAGKIDDCITLDPLNIHITHKADRSIKYLAIHFTAGTKSTAGVSKNVKNVFENRKASADFCVDDAVIRQFNADIRNNYCWAVGDKKDTSTGGGRLYGIATNSNTISIEICSTLRSGSRDYSNHEGWTFTPQALDNARKLAKILMKQYNIPLERVVRHYDISGKLCPGIIGWNDGPLKTSAGKVIGKNNSAEWQKFLESLKD